MDEMFMEEALKEARIALYKKETPVGCVITKNNKIIARGHNKTNEQHNPLAHAELLALSSLDCTDELVFYITCEPCIMCLDILYKLKARFVYGCNNPIFGGLTVLGMHKFLKLNYKYLETMESITLLKQFYLQGNPNAPIEKRKRDVDTTILFDPLMK